MAHNLVFVNAWEMELWGTHDALSEPIRTYYWMLYIFFNLDCLDQCELSGI